VQVIDDRGPVPVGEGPGLCEAVHRGRAVVRLSGGIQGSLKGRNEVPVVQRCGDEGTDPVAGQLCHELLLTA
jgi:hypothetical protein